MKFVDSTVPIMTGLLLSFVVQGNTVAQKQAVNSHKDGYQDIKMQWIQCLPCRLVQQGCC